MRWLHLSDIHFPKDKGDTEKSQILSSLGTYLGLISKGEKIDYVFITGDLRHAKNENETTAAKIANGLKEQILNVINVKPENVYIVPGNHDLTRTEDAKKFRESYIGSNQVNEAEWKTQINNFAFYQSFLKEFYGHGTIADKYWKEMSEKMHYIVSLPEAELLLLNTAIFAYESKDDKGKLCIGWEYVKPLINKLQETKKQIIVLAHHSPDFLCMRDMNKLVHEDNGKYVLPDTTFYLCGHTHTDTATQYGPFRILTLGATCSIGDGVKNQICIGTLNSGRVSYEYHTHTYTNKWEITLKKHHSKIQTRARSIKWIENEDYISDVLLVKKSGGLFNSGWTVNNKDTSGNVTYTYFYYDDEDSTDVQCDLSKQNKDVDVLFIKKGPLAFTYKTEPDDKDEFIKVSGNIQINNDLSFSRSWYNNNIALNQPIRPADLARFVLKKPDLNSKETSEQIINRDDLGITVKYSCKSEKIPLSADFCIDKTSVMQVDQSITFKPTTDYKDKNVKYQWDFGDESAPSNEKEPNHTYKEPGQKKVTLSVKRENGESAEASLNIEIIAEKPKIEPVDTESEYKYWIENDVMMVNIAGIGTSFTEDKSWSIKNSKNGIISLNRSRNRNRECYNIEVPYGTPDDAEIIVTIYRNGVIKITSSTDKTWCKIILPNEQWNKV